MANEATFTTIHVDTARDWRGGQAQVEALVRGLTARGDRVVLVTPPGSRLADRLRDSDVEIVADAPRGDWDWRAGHRLARLARERAADLIHVHSARAHAVARWAARSIDLPIVVSRRVDFPIGGNWFSRRKYLHPSLHYLAISKAVRDALVAGGVDPQRVFIVPSGVDPGKFTYGTDRAATRRSLGLSDEHFLVCTVAALTDHKDPPVLVEAAASAVRRMPNLRFIWLGEGEMRAEVEERIRRLELGDCFRLMGFRDNVEPFLAASDLFALSSHLEGLCTSLLDAMLLRLPIVATTAGGIPDVVIDGETGLLVPPKSPRAFADAIVNLAQDDALRKHLAEAGARRVREHFTVDRTVEWTESAYRAIRPARTSRCG